MSGEDLQQTDNNGVLARTGESPPNVTSSGTTENGDVHAKSE